MPYERYTEILQRCDIALLPLRDTDFNRMKSDLKFLECAAHGVVAVIYLSMEQFEQRLCELIERHDQRDYLTAAAYRWLASHRLLSQHFRKRIAWYLQLRRELPRLDAELRSRAPDLWA